MDASIPVKEANHFSPQLEQPPRLTSVPSRSKTQIISHYGQYGVHGVTAFQRVDAQ